MLRNFAAMLTVCETHDHDVQFFAKTPGPEGMERRGDGADRDQQRRAEIGDQDIARDRPAAARGAYCEDPVIVLLSNMLQLNADREKRGWRQL